MKQAPVTAPNIDKPQKGLNDLSHIFANPNLDQAQAHHDNLPKEARRHLIDTIAHKAGLRGNPGPYKGPPITVPGAVPSDQDTRDLSVGMQEQQSKAALSKASQDQPTVPPLPPIPSPSKIRQAAGAPPSLDDTSSPTGTPPGASNIPAPPTLNPQLGGLAPLPNPSVAGSGGSESTKTGP